MSNPYEEKQEQRRRRFEERAERAEADAAASDATASRLSDAIPFGQPVLVGHHSEKRHRRDLDRVSRARRRAIDSREKAARLRTRAASVGTGGISSDDPEATQKLRSQLEELEAKREQVKRTNRLYRQGGWDAVVNAGLVSKASVPELTARMEQLRAKVPYPPFHLSNLSASIRRVRRRLEELERETQRRDRARAAGESSSTTHEGTGYRIEEHLDDNRLRLFFDARPPKELCRQLRAAGWRWAPSSGAWQRQLNPAARMSVRSLLPALEEL